MKTVFIVPGLGESAENNPAYRKIAGYFRKRDIKPLIVPIQWKYRTMSDYILQFEEFYKINKLEENIFLGFSFGAFIAFVASTRLKNETLVLCLHILGKIWKVLLKSTVKR